MKTVKCEFCGGDVVDGKQKFHHRKVCPSYQEEGVDHLVCRVCGYRSPMLTQHIKIHGLSSRDYRAAYHGALLVLPRIVKLRAENVRKKGGYKPVRERRRAVQCHVCGQWYQPETSRRHFEECVPAHPDKYEKGRDYVSCPECEAPMLRLGQHLRLKHGWTNDRIQMEVNKGLKLTADVVVEKRNESVDFEAAQRKREATHLSRHGYVNPFADPAVQEKIRQTSQRRYHSSHPMQNEGVRLRQTESAHRGPSGQELFFDAHTCDNVVYSGGGSRYIRTKTGVRKYDRVVKDLNPDFLVLPDSVLESAQNCLEQGKPFDRQKHRTRYVMELLGDYYHSEEVIGVPEDEHAKELVEAYASVGIQCLVLWEKDVLGRWNEIEPEVSAWIDRAIADMDERPIYRRSTKSRVDGRRAMLECPYGSGRMFRTQDSLRRWMESKRNYWRPGMEEGRNYVVCRECGTRVVKLAEHLRRSHGMTKTEYLEKYPGSRMVAG